ncbi:MAG: phosphatidylglycerol lysyltransferase domain-containing protein [Clostridiales bacterium]|nr:phosphatidylglycerol lysyltransferase domain-containing protein [Clostridiales bacterium]
MRNAIIQSTSTSTGHRLEIGSRTALQFKPLTVDSIPLIEKLLPMSRSRANDYSIGGLLMWADYFGYEYCIYGNTLFIKGVSEIRPELPAFSLPVGAMPLSCAVDLIRDYCRVNGIDVRFSAVPDDRIDELRSIMNGKLERLDDWRDYIYDAISLALLAGKRYGKKRNHVNQFMTQNPDHRIEPITYSNLLEVRQAYVDWLTDTPVDTPSATQESAKTLEVLDNYAIYPFEGIALRDNEGRIVAFTIGEVIGDTLFTHIEKIDHLVAGAGETVNKLFAAYILGLHPSVQYINREEDAGDEGLRQAKLSYHPDIILNKYDVYR